MVWTRHGACVDLVVCAIMLLMAAAPVPGREPQSGIDHNVGKACPRGGQEITAVTDLIRMEWQVEETEDRFARFR